MSNILVTGGAGYIGSHVVEQLIDSKKKVFIIDNLSTGHRKLINKKAKFFFGDITKYKDVDFLISKNKFFNNFLRISKIYWGPLLPNKRC